jgi:uncharacterized membrane protein YqaE (UPF0057 family)
VPSRRVGGGLRGLELGVLGGDDVAKVLLVLLCLVLPFLAVLIKKGLCIQVLWAFLLQLLGHIPGVIYGIYQVVKD